MEVEPRNKEIRCGEQFLTLKNIKVTLLSEVVDLARISEKYQEAWLVSLTCRPLEIMQLHVKYFEENSESLLLNNRVKMKCRQLTCSDILKI